MNDYDRYAQEEDRLEWMDELDDIDIGHDEDGEAVSLPDEWEENRFGDEDFDNLCDAAGD